MRNAFMLIKPNWRQYSGGSSPWNCSRFRPHSRLARRTSSSGALTKTPTFITNGGSERMRAAAASTEMWRGLWS